MSRWTDEQWTPGALMRMWAWFRQEFGRLSFALRVLAACHVTETHRRPSTTTVLELLQWVDAKVEGRE